MQRLQMLRNARRERMITEETRATASTLMMIISTKLASVFDQFYYSMVELEYLMFEKNELRELAETARELKASTDN